MDEYHINCLSRKTEQYTRGNIGSLFLGKEEYEDFQHKLRDRQLLLIREAATHKPETYESLMPSDA